MKSINNMALTELRDYATILENKVAQLETEVVKADELKRNCESAYETVRMLKNEIETIRTEANTKLQFVNQAVSTCYSSIVLATKK